MEKKPDRNEGMVVARGRSMADEEAKSGKARGGRPKEKEQISTRMDRALIDLLRAHLGRHKGVRITDMLERGALLALREADGLEPQFMNAGLSLNDVSAEAARDAIDLCAMHYIAKHRQLTELEAMAYEFHLKTLKSVRKWEGYAEALRMAVNPPPKP